MATMAADTFMNSRRSIPARLLFLLISNSSTIIVLSDLLFGLYLPAGHFYFVFHFIAVGQGVFVVDGKLIVADFFYDAYTCSPLALY